MRIATQSRVAGKLRLNRVPDGVRGIGDSWTRHDHMPGGADRGPAERAYPRAGESATHGPWPRQLSQGRVRVNYLGPAASDSAQAAEQDLGKVDGIWEVPREEKVPPARGDMTTSKGRHIQAREAESTVQKGNLPLNRLGLPQRQRVLAELSADSPQGGACDRSPPEGQAGEESPRRHRDARREAKRPGSVACRVLDDIAPDDHRGRAGRAVLVALHVDAHETVRHEGDLAPPAQARVERGDRAAPQVREFKLV